MQGNTTQYMTISSRSSQNKTRAAQDTARHDHTIQNQKRTNTRHGKQDQAKPRHDNTRQGNTTQDMSNQNKPRHDSIYQNNIN